VKTESADRLRQVFGRMRFGKGSIGLGARVCVDADSQTDFFEQPTFINSHILFLQ
jgi:hypothetical protein